MRVNVDIGDRALRLLLAVLIVLLPLAAHASPAHGQLHDAAVQTPATPCHGAFAAAPAEAPVAHDCPHCLGDAPPSQCQCLSFVASAAIPSAEASIHSLSPGPGLPGLAPADPWPDGSNERLYRPPIG